MDKQRILTKWIRCMQDLTIRISDGFLLMDFDRETGLFEQYSGQLMSILKLMAMICVVVLFHPIQDFYTLSALKTKFINTT